MFKPFSALVAAIALIAPAAGLAADAGPAPDLDAFQKAVIADGLTCELGPGSLLLREDSADRWVIEFRCASVDDGRLGVFPKKPGGAKIIYNCAKAEIAGMSCAKTNKKVAFASLNADIKKIEFSSQCKVADTRLMGISPNKKTSYLEVRCDDTNLSGQVLQYDIATQKVTQLVSCDNAQELGGGCRFPGAVKHARDIAGAGMGAALGNGAASNVGGIDSVSQSRGMVPFGGAASAGSTGGVTGVTRSIPGQ